MKTLHSTQVWTFSDANPDGGLQSCQVRQDEGILVNSYTELAKKVAALQYNNPGYLLLFRGQNNDYRIRNTRNTTIRPTLFRRDENQSVQQWNDGVYDKYQDLHKAENLLKDTWPAEGQSKIRVKRNAVIRWSILQHYEVCDTPLLDVSQSLLVAASFGSLTNPRGETNEDLEDEGIAETSYLYVIGLPHIAGPVTSCANHDIQILRLASLCPPEAIRPHIQEGFLIGEYPELRTANEKMDVRLPETDFGKRLIAKFKFYPNEFWAGNSTFPQLPKKAMYPNAEDVLHGVCQNVKRQLTGGR